MDQLVSPSGSSWIQMGPVGSNLTQWDPVGPIWIQIGASSVKYYVPEFGACTPIVFIRWMIAGKFARSVFLRYCNIVFWKTLNDSNRIIKFLHHDHYQWCMKIGWKRASGRCVIIIGNMQPNVGFSCPSQNGIQTISWHISSFTGERRRRNDPSLQSSQ